jgi:CRP-like cAMP-binding protein
LELRKGERLYVKGEPGRNALFFILNGSVEVLRENKSVTVLGPKEIVGEFPLLDPALNYTVTIEAREQTSVAQVSEKDFVGIAKTHPEVWRNMAVILADRLRHTNEASDQAHGAQRRLRPGDTTIGDLLNLLSGLPVSSSGRSLSRLSLRAARSQPLPIELAVILARELRRFKTRASKHNLNLFGAPRVAASVVAMILPYNDPLQRDRI